MARSDTELRAWAHEHLVYEAAMLSHALKRVADAGLSDQDHNAFIESFAVHVRCLRDFVWRDRNPRNKRQQEDAFASDLCADGVWQSVRPEVPEVLQIEEDRNRIGREIVHLSYHRLGIDAESKNWNLSEFMRVIVEALHLFSEKADPNRLAEETRQFLASMPVGVPLDPRLLTGFHGVTAATQAAGGLQPLPPKNVSRGTIPVAGYTADAIDPDSST
jgi:hypothetical protein